MEKIAIYWGAFNPPTLGHKEIIVKMLTQKHVEKIIFSPDGYREDKNYGIDKTQRCEMIEIFFQEVAQLWLNIEYNDFFLKRKEYTTTMEVEHYYIKHLWYQPFHIFWTDTIKNIPQWSGNKDKYLETKLKKFFIMRKGEDIPHDIEMQNDTFLDLDIPEISSTMVREALRDNKPVKHMLTPGVYEYILKNKLYH